MIERKGEKGEREKRRKGKRKGKSEGERRRGERIVTDYRKEKRQRGNLNVCQFKREEGGKTKDRKGEGKRGKRKKERQKHRRGLIKKHSGTNLLRQEVLGSAAQVKFQT